MARKFRFWPKQWESKLLSIVVPWALVPLTRSWRITRDIHPDTQALLDSNTPVIFAMWHGRMYCTPGALPKENTAILISSSNDGNMITTILKSLGFHQFIRGSSKQDGSQAFRDMIRALGKQHLSIMMTVDGPRGPIHQVKPGITRVASIAQAPIIPVIPSCTSYCVQSKKAWDRFSLPSLFNPVSIVLDKPIWVPTKSQGYDAEESTQQLQHTLDALTKQFDADYYASDVA